MNIKKWVSLVLVLCMMLSMCACGGNVENIKNAIDGVVTTPAAIDNGETPAAPVTVTDMLGRSVEILPGSYKKVVCVGAGALRMYSYIGDVNLLCGVEDIDNTTLEQRPAMFDSVARPYVLAYGDVFNTLPTCGVGGPMAQSPEIEKIMLCEPDIIISEYEDQTVADDMQSKIGVPVITLKAGAKGVFDEAFSGSMELLGKVFGKEDRTAEINKFVAEQKTAIETAVAGIAEEDKPNVYICGLGNWGTTDHLMTAENYVSFQVAGVKNVLSGLGIEGVGPVEQEKFLELSGEMDIIIMDAAAVKNIKPLYQQDPTMFNTCKAWNEGEVYLEMAYNAYYTNFEIALINTWFIAKTVYPEQFADIDITAKTNKVTKVFFGEELADAIFACGSSFGGYQKIDTETFFN